MPRRRSPLARARAPTRPPTRSMALPARGPIPTGLPCPAPGQPSDALPQPAALRPPPPLLAPPPPPLPSLPRPWPASRRRAPASPPVAHRHLLARPSPPQLSLALPQKYLCTPQWPFKASKRDPPQFFAVDAWLGIFTAMVMGLQHALSMIGGACTSVCTRLPVLAPPCCLPCPWPEARTPARLLLPPPPSRALPPARLPPSAGASPPARPPRPLLPPVPSPRLGSLPAPSAHPRTTPLPPSCPPTSPRPQASSPPPP